MKKNTIKDPKAIKYFKQSFQNGQLGLLFTGIDAIFILSALKYYIYILPPPHYVKFILGFSNRFLEFYFFEGIHWLSKKVLSQKIHDVPKMAKGAHFRF